LYRVAALGSNRAIIVVDIKQIAEQQDAQQTTRRDAYTAPRLKVFGPVGVLTQGGSMGLMEGSGPMDMKP
jgi:hypothetical protein